MTDSTDEPATRVVSPNFSFVFQLSHCPTPQRTNEPDGELPHSFGDLPSNARLGKAAAVELTSAAAPSGYHGPSDALALTPDIITAAFPRPPLLRLHPETSPPAQTSSSPSLRRHLPSSYAFSRMLRGPSTRKTKIKECLSCVK